MKKLFQGTVILTLFMLMSIISCEKASVARPTSEPCSINLALVEGNWKLDSITVSSSPTLVYTTTYWDFNEDKSLVITGGVNTHFRKFRNVITIDGAGKVIDYLTTSEMILYWEGEDNIKKTFYFHK